MIGALLLGITLLAAPPGKTPVPAFVPSLPIVEARPLPEDAVVYFVLVDRFACRFGPCWNADQPRARHGGNLAGLRRQLPYLKALGVTHLWLSPLQEQITRRIDDTEPYHGYWPASLDHIDDEHMGIDVEFTRLIFEANALGIGVVLDLVVNHLGYGAGDPHHLVRPQCGDDDTTRCLFGLPDVQSENPEVRKRLIALLSTWTKNFPDLAGVRIDAFKHVDRETLRELRAALLPHPGAWQSSMMVGGNSDDGGSSSLRRAEKSRFTVIAEDWGATVGDAHVDDIVDSGAADAVFDFGFYGPARDFLQGRMRTAAFAHALEARERAATSTTTQTLPFLDNHDVETWTHAVGAARSPIGAALLLSDREVPVITWGTEVQRPGGAGDPENRSDMPWDEVAKQQQDPSSSLAFWTRAITLRRRHPVLRRGALRIVAKDVDDAAPHFLVYAREAADDRAVVAVALDRALRHVEPLNGRHLIDTAAWHGRAKEEAGNLVVDVDADGAVVVILSGGP